MATTDASLLCSFFAGDVYSCFPGPRYSLFNRHVDTLNRKARLSCVYFFFHFRIVIFACLAAKPRVITRSCLFFLFATSGEGRGSACNPKTANTLKSSEYLTSVSQTSSELQYPRFIWNCPSVVPTKRIAFQSPMARVSRRVRFFSDL